jgi:hypothetical protein
MLAWLRTEFRRINTALEFEAPAGESRHALMSALLDGVALLPRAPSDPCTEDDALACHLQAGMLHAACMRHGVAPDDARLRPCVEWLLEVERRWSLAPRFLALPYLLLNSAEDDWPITFLASDAERQFIAANADGVAVYETAWTLVSRIRVLGLTHPAAPSILSELARIVGRLVPVHRDLQAALDHDAYFQHVRYYYEAVTVDGRVLAGVNAGDQAWSMALDLALGLAQPHAEYQAYMRSRLPYLPPSHRELVRQEIAESGWLDEMVRAASSVPWGQALATSAVGVYDALVRATWAHMDLAVAFIDRGLGTSGTEMRFLEETVRMRRDHPALARLRDLAASP